MERRKLNENYLLGKEEKKGPDVTIKKTFETFGEVRFPSPHIPPNVFLVIKRSNTHVVEQKQNIFISRTDKLQQKFSLET